jgi:hypothetical protein
MKKKFLNRYILIFFIFYIISCGDNNIIQKYFLYQEDIEESYNYIMKNFDFSKSNSNLMIDPSDSFLNSQNDLLCLLVLEDATEPINVNIIYSNKRDLKLKQNILENKWTVIEGYKVKKGKIILTGISAKSHNSFYHKK